MSAMWYGQLDGPPAAHRSRQHLRLQAHELAWHGAEQPRQESAVSAYQLRTAGMCIVIMPCIFPSILDSSSNQLDAVQYQQFT